MKIEVHKQISAPKKPKPEGELGFGRYFTDHMLVMNYTEGKGWHDARIVPYGPISLDPSAMVLHYGQEVFEGLKAYRTADGRILLFRPEENARRMNVSNRRMCIPEIDEELWVHCVKEAVSVDRDWVPYEEGTSLYIRPFVFATDPFLGVRASHTYLFMIILSPVGSYYPEGIKPVKIYIESEYVRAVKGGTGFAKCGGNYAASIRSQMNAYAKGYTQVLWLDGVERKYIEEVGTMNVFFQIGDEIVTPALTGSVLGGITRMSVIELLRSWGYSVNERLLSLEEVLQAAETGRLVEAFGTGTAAVISPIGELYVDGRPMVINEGKIGPLAQKLYDTITGIQNGRIPDPFGWVVPVV